MSSLNKFTVDKSIGKRQTLNRETLSRCGRWIVNNMNPDDSDLQLDDVFESDFAEELMVGECCFFF